MFAQNTNTTTDEDSQAMFLNLTTTWGNSAAIRHSLWCTIVQYADNIETQSNTQFSIIHALSKIIF